VIRILLVLLLAVRLAAEVRVEASCPWVDREGYTPVLVTVTSDRPAVVHLEATSDGNRAVAEVTASPGERVQRTLLLPGSSRRWSSGVQLRWSAGGFGESRENLSPQGYRELDVVMLDPEESFALKELRDQVAAAVGEPPDNRGYRSSGSSTYPEARFNRWSVTALPDRWQGWPAWLTLVTTPAGDRRLNEAQRQAIAAWTHAGGRLLVTQPAQVAAWNSFGARVAVLDKGQLIERIREVWGQRGHDPQRVEVPGTGMVPVYGFVTIAVLFAILVGPLNLWWCARQGRRHLLLVTTPVLSLVASVVLLTYGLLADGLGVRRVVVQVMALDAVHGRAASWQAMSFFAGLAPSRITLDGDDLLAIVPESREDLEQPATTLVWDGGQQAEGEWIPARTNRQLLLGTVRAERRRLQVTPAASGWQVANGFDVPLQQFQWHDAEGRTWQYSGSLAPGAVAPLQSGTDPLEVPLARLPVAALDALQGGQWTALFQGPLLPVPGPAASDVQPIRSWVVGRSGGVAGQGGF
jgi:hypothetical protein